MGFEIADTDKEGRGIPVNYARVEEIWIQKKKTVNRVYIRLGLYTDQASYVTGNHPVEIRRINVPLDPPEIPEVEEGEPEPIVDDPFAGMRDQVIEEVDAFIAKAYLLAKKMPEWSDAKDV